MATTRWTGTVSGAWGTSGNWSNGVPTDVALFPKGATNPPSSGMDLDTTQFSKLIVERGATYDIGSSSSPLICQTEYLLHEGLGTFYFNYTDGGAYAGSPRGHLVCRSANLQNAMVIAGTSQFEQLDIMQGRVSLGNTATQVSRVNIQPETGGINQAALTIITGVTVADLVNDGGRVTVDSGADVTRFVVSSGLVENAADLNCSAFLLGGVWDQRLVSVPSNTLNLYALGGVVETRNVVGAIISSLYYVKRATIYRGPGYQYVNGEFEIGEEFLLPG